MWWWLSVSTSSRHFGIDPFAPRLRALDEAEKKLNARRRKERVEQPPGQRDLLGENHTYLFTLIHKFHQEVRAPYSTRSDIVVISDEAHRTQYGRLARNMRAALPYAAYIGFTGTPLIGGPEDALTKEVFGEYVSTYDFQRAVEDGATVPLYYDNRGEKLKITTEDLNERVAAILDDADLEEDQEAKVRRQLRDEYNIITAPERLDTIAEDLVAHYIQRWQTGKAMLICLDKPPHSQNV